MHSQWTVRDMKQVRALLSLDKHGHPTDMDMDVIAVIQRPSDLIDGVLDLEEMPPAYWFLACIPTEMSQEEVQEAITLGILSGFFTHPFNLKHNETPTMWELLTFIQCVLELKATKALSDKDTLTRAREHAAVAVCNQVPKFETTKGEVFDFATLTYKYELGKAAHEFKAEARKAILRRDIARTLGVEAPAPDAILTCTYDEGDPFDPQEARRELNPANVHASPQKALAFSTEAYRLHHGVIPAELCSIAKAAHSEEALASLARDRAPLSAGTHAPMELVATLTGCPEQKTGTLAEVSAYGRELEQVSGNFRIAMTVRAYDSVIPDAPAIATILDVPVGTDAQMIKDALNIAFDSKILLKEQPHDIAMYILLTKVALKAENRREEARLMPWNKPLLQLNLSILG